MIIRIEPSEYEIARSVLQQLDIHLAVTALLEGTSPGEIFVDDPFKPKSVFAWTMRRFFLAGQSDNHEFNIAVKALFQDRIYPQACEKELEGYTLFYTPHGWGKVIKDVILKDKNPIEDLRHYYALNLVGGNWHMTAPEGFTMITVDEDLLAKNDLANLEELVEEMQSERSSVEDFLEKSFGFCMIHGDELAAWCLSEYNSGERCEVGIQTRQEYQRRGLATTTATALAEHAQSLGITDIGWHCYAGNEASIATALKLGYKKVCEYPTYWAMFVESINLAVNGNTFFNRQNYAEAIVWYLKSLENDEAPAWVFWNTACAYAHLDDKSASFEYLLQAVERGFSDIEFIRNSKHFTKWHHTQEWVDLISKLE
jgi:RimJ/RimL family protein N-acetyltransferase